MSGDIPLDGYITSAEAAKVLGVTQRRVSQLCAIHEHDKQDGLESVKVARRWFVKRSAVYAYLAQKGQ